MRGLKQSAAWFTDPSFTSYVSPDVVRGAISNGQASYGSSSMSGQFPQAYSGYGAYPSASTAGYPTATTAAKPAAGSGLLSSLGSALRSGTGSSSSSSSTALKTAAGSSTGTNALLGFGVC
jgi:hypothetical protein